MDKSKSSGISIDQIKLLNCNIKYNDNSVEPKMKVALTKIDRNYDKDESTMFLFVSFDIMSEIKKPMFDFTCDFVAIYERDIENSNMEWSEFKTPIAIAHIIPYLREFVSNMTNRMPVPVLNIRPINALLLYEEYENKQKNPKKTKKQLSN